MDELTNHRYKYFNKVPCSAVENNNSLYDLESSPSCYEAALAVVASQNEDTPKDSIQNSD